MDHLTLEERIQYYVDKFITEWVEYDIDFITAQVSKEYPWKASDSWKYFIYSHVFPTKEARDIELGLWHI